MKNRIGWTAISLCLLLSGCFSNKPLPRATPDRGMVVFVMQGDHIKHALQMPYPVVAAIDFEGNIDWPREAANRGQRFDTEKNKLVGDENIYDGSWCFFPSQVCISVNHLPGSYVVQRLVHTMPTGQGGSYTTIFELDPADKHFKFLLPASRVAFLGSFKWSVPERKTSIFGKSEDPTFSTSVWQGGPDERAALQMLAAEPMFIKRYPEWRLMVEARLRQLSQNKAAVVTPPAPTPPSKPAVAAPPKKSQSKKKS